MGIHELRPALSVLRPVLFDFVKFESDFEKSIHSSLLIVWPSVQMKKRRFRLGQNW